MTRLIVFVALLAGIACSSGTEADDASISSVSLRGSVRDTANQPVPLAFVGWEAWPQPTPGLSWSSAAVADSQGRFSIPLDSIGVAMLDSVLLFYPHLWCSPYRGDSLVLRDIPVASGKVTTIDDIELRPAMNAPAMLATGQYCGDASYQWEENQYSGLELGLWIDEITDSVRGRWRLVFQESRGDDYGHFSGTVQGDSLILDLRLDQPWDACRNYILALPVIGTDTLAIGRYRSDGCPTQPVGIRLSGSHEMQWPFE
jgi:hypothetical protein